ncbi:MAG: 1-deoxy-D-xylulose-5-phosphate synthase, partial [Kiritimatiellae bacterium]|nr:1-deoxy-D-xylulose-5-phosphate synthase [Kiritimatiellia bacterium]
HPEKWHGISSFDPANGKSKSKGGTKSYSGAFGSTMFRLAESDEKIVAITAAMQMGTGLSDFAERFPSRFYDVGISEEHAVVFACGLAVEGFKPVFAVYSTFIQRSIDYIIHDMCLQNLPVVLCLDRAGVVGDDGPTHHGVFDIALLRPVPGLVIMQPRDEAELANMLFTATRMRRPVVIRYPRGSSPGVEEPDQFEAMEIGKAEVLRDIDAEAVAEERSRVWLWALGDMLPLAESAADILVKAGVDAGVVNARFVQPLDEELLARHADGSSAIVTLENGVVKGGFGSGIEEWLSEIGSSCKVIKVGWPDEFIPQGKQDELMQQFGLTAEAVAKKVQNACRV